RERAPRNNAMRPPEQVMQSFPVFDIKTTQGVVAQGVVAAQVQARLGRRFALVESCDTEGLTAPASKRFAVKESR
ncbi:MAG: hypothetical protein ACK4XK_13820, partial [Casimicrobiaceae bacterium]